MNGAIVATHNEIAAVLDRVPDAVMLEAAKHEVVHSSCVEDVVATVVRSAFVVAGTCSWERSIYELYRRPIQSSTSPVRLAIEMFGGTHREWHTVFIGALYDITTTEAAWNERVKQAIAYRGAK